MPFALSLSKGFNGLSPNGDRFSLNRTEATMLGCIAHHANKARLATRMLALLKLMLGLFAWWLIGVSFVGVKA